MVDTVSKVRGGVGVELGRLCGNVRLQHELHVVASLL